MGPRAVGKQDPFEGSERKYYFPVLRADETGNSHYGYGWDVTKTNRNTKRIWHNGSNSVFYADFYRFIDEGVTIILATNNWQRSFNSTGRVISSIIFEPDYQPVVRSPTMPQTARLLMRSFSSLSQRI